MFFTLLKHISDSRAPTPTNISTKSDPEIEKKGTLASPAIALANKVLPVPGGPISNAPLGILPPSLLNFFGLLDTLQFLRLLLLLPLHLQHH